MIIDILRAAEGKREALATAQSCYFFTLAQWEKMMGMSQLDPFSEYLVAL